MKSITRIVITGGPCAGKTTAFGRIEQELTQNGYKVFIVPETFTDMHNGGIKLLNYDTVTFQTMLMKYLQYKEVIYTEAAEKAKEEKVVILFDRGMIDNKAYMTEEQFEQVLKNLGKTEIELRDEYDAVIHLVTAANGAEKFYSLDNTARYETIEMARIVDNNLIRAWTGHPHFRIVDNSTGFDEKINRLVKEIYSVLGIPVPVEIERKFLIEMPDLEFIQHNLNCTKSEIIQTYLTCDEKDVEKRIRQRGLKGYSYYYTEKRKASDASRFEIERRISEKEYLHLMTKWDTHTNPIKKTRYCFVYNNLYFELDVYPFWNDRAILEIELTSESEIVEIPEFISVIKEVTNDDEYKNSSLAKSIPV